MRKLIFSAAMVTLLVSLSSCGAPPSSDPAAARQADQTRKTMDVADRAVGFPSITNFAQKTMLRNSYEDMDQTTLVWIYAQGIDGRLVCYGQAVGYGVPYGTQFTAPKAMQWVPYPDSVQHSNGYGSYEMMDQPEPNGLYMPSGAAEATILNWVDPKTGSAHTALSEPRLVTIPFRVKGRAVAIDCDDEVDPGKVTDAHETSLVKQRGVQK